MADSKLIARQVGASIRRFRTQRGLSQEKLALECGMNPAFLGHVERGLRCPTVYTLERICEGLGISVAELFLANGSADFPRANAAALQHISVILAGLTPGQAQCVADMVDSAAALARQSEPR